MSGYVDNRCSQATVGEVEALIRERDDARAKLAALVEAIDAAGRAVTGDEVQTRAQLVESLRRPTRNHDIVELIGYIDALRAARGEP